MTSCFPFGSKRLPLVILAPNKLLQSGDFGSIDADERVTPGDVTAVASTLSVADSILVACRGLCQKVAISHGYGNPRASSSTVEISSSHHTRVQPRIRCSS